MNIKLLAPLAGIVLFATSLLGQVPQLINYQGRVAVGTPAVNFDGAGQFKFALVNAGGATSYWSNDGTSTAGSQPVSAVTLTVTKGLYSVMLGDTALSNMAAIPGSVFNNADVRLRVWFNDGTHGWQRLTPDQRIAAVGYAMMANTVPDGSITAAKLAPGVGGGAIADGSITAAKLAAGAAAANLAAGNLSAVASGGIIGSTDADNISLLEQGYVRDPAGTEVGETWTRMPDGDAVAAHAAVWTGTELLIWGGVVPSSVDPLSFYQASNLGIRYNPATGVWSPMSTVGAPQARYGHRAVWTGTEMIVWGGITADASLNETILATGGRYNPTTNGWTSMAPNVDTSGAPPGVADARCFHLAFWTGTDMIIWGGTGTNPPGFAPRGRRYNPVSNTWSNIATSLSQMSEDGSWSGVWTGTEMILWNRQLQASSDPPVAGRYSPAADAWQAMPRIPGDPVIADTGFTTVWTGSHMILWGGSTDVTGASNAGYRFNPATNSWSAITTTGAPAARQDHYAVMVGGEMIVWSGRNTSGSTILYNDGGRYNPTTNSWQGLSITDAPAYRTEATVTAAGDKLIVWAGGLTSNDLSAGKFLKHGGIYQPGPDAWSLLSNGSPAPRFGHTAVWTGTDLIVWGGTSADNSASLPEFDPTFNDGARFNIATGIWTPLPGLNAPTGRFGHTAVWTGTEMIIWGGQYFDRSSNPAVTVTLNTGARYNPVANTWTPTATSFAPAARSKHTAVWAGPPVNQMIIWGGSADGVTTNINTGGRYIPASDSWANLTTTNAPAATSGHHSVWTGNEMIVVGGSPVVGSRYYPLSNSWLAMGSLPANLSDFENQTTLWTGGEMLLFQPSNMTLLLASYSPIADYWLTLSNTGAPAGNAPSPACVWTGNEMIVWGAKTGMSPSMVVAGGRYAPASGTWTSLPAAGAPATDYGAGIWTGSEMLLWGGTPGTAGTSGKVSDKGHRYRPPQYLYLYRKP